MGEQIERNKQEEMEIDLLEIARLLWRKSMDHYIMPCSRCRNCRRYTKFLVTPQYTASSMIYVLGESTSITSIADVQVGTELTGDFTTLAKESSCFGRCN